MLAGQEEGTLFVPQTSRLQSRKRWIAFFHHPKGTLFVDAGARKALRENGKSLLPPGVSRCEGDLKPEKWCGFAIWMEPNSPAGIPGLVPQEIKARELKRVEVVHRDDL